MRSCTALLAYTALVLGLVRSQELDWVTLALILAALGLALAGSVLTEWRKVSAFPAPCRYGLWLLVAGQMAWSLYSFPTLYPLLPGGQDVFRLVLGLWSLVVISYAQRDVLWPRARFGVAVALYACAGGWLIAAASHQPLVDVWEFQQHGCELLVSGRDPYTGQYKNWLGPSAHELYSPRVFHDNMVQTCPYPPLSLLAVLPGYLAGDIRWMLVAAIAATAVGMTATAWRLGLPPGHPAELAAVAFLCNPLNWRQVEMGWTDPLMACAATWTTWLLVRGPRWAIGPALGAVLSLKQVGVLWLVPAWATRRMGWQQVVAGVGFALMIALPFVLWNPSAFALGVVEFQLEAPFRPDALSVPAWIYERTGVQMSAAAGFVGAGIVSVLLLLASPLSLARMGLGAAALYLAFFVFNKQAFLNYYWLAGSFLPAAILAAAAEQATRERPPPSGTRLPGGT
jgi:hypothetical protein